MGFLPKGAGEAKLGWLGRYMVPLGEFGTLGWNLFFPLVPKLPKGRGFRRLFYWGNGEINAQGPNLGGATTRAPEF